LFKNIFVLFFSKIVLIFTNLWAFKKIADVEVKVGCLIPIACTGQVQGFHLTQHWFEYFSNRYMFRSYDYLQVEIFLYAVRLTCVYNLKVGCLIPVACTRSGSGFPSNATLV
jgi:hypothetical protein